MHVAVEALYDAADDDSATGGPDSVRQIWPVVVTVTADGYRRVPDDELAAVAAQIVAERTEQADGNRAARPRAPRTAGQGGDAL